VAWLLKMAFPPSRLRFATRQRSNATPLKEPCKEFAEYGAKLLFENGIRLAGVDLIGDRIIEFNVFSTGGLYDSIQFSGVRFDDVVSQRLTI
jgi:glutathione synthase